MPEKADAPGEAGAGTAEKDVVVDPAVPGHRSPGHAVRSQPALHPRGGQHRGGLPPADDQHAARRDRSVHVVPPGDDLPTHASAGGSRRLSGDPTGVARDEKAAAPRPD